MDPYNNQAEQASVAKEIMANFDACPEDGEPTAVQLDKAYQFAYRLAELVQALNEWEANGGFFANCPRG